MKNRVSLPLKILLFAFAVGTLSIMCGMYVHEPESKFILQTSLALGGAAMMCLTMAFWPLRPRSWNFKLALVGCAIFLTGVTWLAASFGGSIVSFYGFLMACSIILGIAAVCAPKSTFEIGFA